MPSLTLWNVLVVFVFSGIAAIGWHVGAWVTGRLLPK